MEPFNYHSAKSIDSAASLLAEKPDAQLLAGGMTLLPTIKQRLSAPSDLVDLQAIDDLKGVRKDGDDLVIGAMTRHHDVASSSLVASEVAGLSQLASQIGDPAVRHRGTIGGSIANADPAADYPAACVALDARIETNRRQIQATEFFHGLFETSLEPAEIITAVRFAIPKACAYVKFRHHISGYAVVGVMVARFGDGVRVGVTGAGPHAFRAVELEKALSHSFSPDAIKGITLSADNMLSDIHFSAKYRANLATVLTRRAIVALATQ